MSVTLSSFQMARFPFLLGFVLALGLIMTQSAVGQQTPKEDSLKFALTTATSDTSKIDVLIELALSYGKSDENNLLYLEKAKKLALDIADSSRLGLIEGHLASYYYFTGQYPLAIQRTEEAVRIYESLQDTMRYIRSVNNLGILFRRIGNYHKSLINNHIQLDYYLAKKDSMNLAKTYNNLGNLYSDYGDDRKAFQYQIKNLRIRQKQEDLLGISSAFNNIALLYDNQGMSDSAIYYYQRALEVPEIKTSTSLFGSIQNNLAIVYKNLRDYDKAEHHLLLALAFRDSVGDNHGSCQSRGNLADTYLLLGKVDAAKKFALEGMELAKKYDYQDELWRHYLHLSKVYERLNNYEEAYRYLGLYADLKDSIRNKDEIRKMAEIQSAYTYNQKAFEDSLNLVQEKELFLKQQELENISIVEKQKRQEVIAWFSAGVGLILLILVIILIKNNRDKSAANKIISDKNEKIEQQKTHLEEKNKEVVDSINYARRIQNAILPTKEKLDTSLPSYGLLFSPKDIISGDFYWMDKVNDFLYVAIADCTGHGVPGAIVSVICANALSKSIEEEGLQETGRILDRTREIVVDQFSKNNSTVQDGMDISFLRFGLNPNGGIDSVQWSGANNPLWILRKEGREIEEVPPNKEPIGKYSHPTPFLTNNIELSTGDSLYLFTDGYADQFGGPKGKKFKRSQLKELIIANRTLSPSDLVKKLSTSFETWKGESEQIDDVCFMTLRIDG